MHNDGVSAPRCVVASAASVGFERRLVTMCCVAQLHNTQLQPVSIQASIQAHKVLLPPFLCGSALVPQNLEDQDCGSPQL